MRASIEGPMATSADRPVLMVLVSMLLGTLLLAGSCDHTQLSGKVEPARVDTKVGEQVELTLEVPPKLDGCVRDELWEVEPASLGEVQHRDESGSKHRRVTFVARSSGTGQIRVLGFCRQTNPQPITTVEVRVR